MRVVRHVWAGFTRLWRKDRSEQELDRELQHFLEASIEAKLGAGMDREAAERAARLELGSPAAVKDWVRDVGWESRLESVWQDVRYAGRILRRNRGFGAAAIATLALGIGASTAIFSVAYGVTMRPLPYPAPDRLVLLYEARPADGRLEHEVSIAAFHAWRQGAPSIESAALYAKPRTRLLADADGTPLALMSVSPSLFDVLGVRPVLGSGFRPEAEYTRYTDEAVLSFSAWQRLFGGRTDVIGRQLEFRGSGDNYFVRIVGVMPQGFAFAEPADVWRPTLLVELPISPLLRQWRYERAVARLRDGVSVARVRAEVVSISSQLAVDFPKTNAGWTAAVVPLHDAIVGNFGRATWLLMASVVVVLLVACINVAGLVASRAVARERETSVRLALGAGSWRLVRLWVAEAMLLGIAGGALGLTLAWLGVKALLAAAPPGIPRIDAINLDAAVLMLSAGATLIAVAFTSVAPVLVARRRNLTTGLRSASAAAGDPPRSHAARVGVIVAQCAGAAVLVALGILLTRSFNKLVATDLGWNPAAVLSLRASPPMPRELERPWARYVDWSERLVRRLEALPEIERAAITTQIPLSADTYPASVARGRGKGSGEDARWPTVQHNVSDGYFETMAIELLEGRAFNSSDRFDALALVDSKHRPPSGSAIVTESLARSLWPGQSALGQPLWLPNIDGVTWREVVGIVEDIDFHAVGETAGHHVFVPWTQGPTGNPRLVVKGSGNTASLVSIVRGVLQEVEPGTHVDQVVPLDALTSRATAQPRFTSRVAMLFAALALLLAAVGIHGTLAYAVRARTREIGIRVALGASTRDILGRTLAAGLMPAVVGGTIGVAAALAIARMFQNLLFEISPLDPLTLVATAGALGGAALVAAIGPAARAARVDPLAALRTE
jgi:putative ABC transport system permease protein